VSERGEIGARARAGAAETASDDEDSKTDAIALASDIDNDKFESIAAPELNQKIAACSARLERRAEVVSRAGYLLRSSDESLDDIPTGDLQPLLCMYWVGRIVQKERVTETDTIA